MTWRDKEIEDDAPEKSHLAILQILSGIIKGSTTGDDEDSEALRAAMRSLELSPRLIRLVLCIKALEEKEGYGFHDRLVAGEYTEPAEVNDLMQAIALVGDDTWEDLKRNYAQERGY